MKQVRGAVEYRYSPHPIASYRLEGLERDEFSVIQSCRYTNPVWNLFWLSEPAVDKLPGSGPRWFRFYTPSANLLSQVIMDVSDQDDLRQALSQHPVGFLDYWSTVNPRLFRTYFNQGGEAWVSIVQQRAQEAEERLIRESPPINFNNLLKGL